ncbi:MAG TPA: Gfo/Idh/MocA family oxidoreductase [Mycobacteriales bacterium]|nr:Gfo/Idh/MocA family oxidoreductase [Mycobacteriales bacterium]
MPKPPTAPGSPDLPQVQPLRVGVIGCGSISRAYAKSIGHYPELVLSAATDRDAPRAQDLTSRFGGTACATASELVLREDVDVVLNLTPHDQHAAVTCAALEAGKHVYSEKPVALTTAECTQLVDLARDQGRRLASAPATFLGESQQTAWKLLREGACGEVKLIYAEVNHGRIERWHPAPAPFYAVGPLVDVGVYPLTLITAFFGPVRRVTAWGALLLPARTDSAGRPFAVTAPDAGMAILELATGPTVRLSVNFFVEATRQRGLEFHGDKGSLVADFMDPAAEVCVGKPLPTQWTPESIKEFLQEPFEPVALVRDPEPHSWGRGLRDLAVAIRGGTAHKASAEHATHVIDVIAAIAESARTGSSVRVHSAFVPPAPEEWAT